MTEMYARSSPQPDDWISATHRHALVVRTEGMKSHDKMTAAELKAVADYALTLSKPQGS
jgi:hypothetical protein